MKAKKYRDSKKAVIYCRVSTEEQAKGGESLSSQAHRCKAFAERNGYGVVQEFIEEGESGRTTNRTMLQQLLGYCFNKDNNIGAVICLKEDRFSRNICNYSQLEKALRESGIKLLFAESNNEESASGRLIRNINNSFAEFESDVNSERTKAGLAEALAKGRWTRPLRGYTFRLNLEGKKQLFPNEDAKYIQKIFNLAEMGIYSQEHIRSEMSKDGFKISKQALSQILHNTVYCGLLPDKYDRNNGEYIQGIHEPLVSQEKFFRVQNILDGKNRTGVKRLRNNPLYPLRGYMYCWVCGNKMTASASRAKGGDLFYYYHCTRPHCNGSRVQKKVLEKKFIEFLRLIQPHEEIINLFEKCVVAKFQEKTKEAEQRIRQINLKITDLESQKSRIINLLAKGTIDEEDGKIEITRIKQEINQQRSILVEMTSGPKVEDCWLFARKMLLHMAEAWLNGDLEFKQQLQGLIMPAGFKFDGKLIKPIKNPYFLSIFQQKTGENIEKGG